MGDREQAIFEVDVRLAEAQELALAKARIEGRREERSPAIGQVGQHARHFVGAKKLRHGLGNFAFLHVHDRIRAAKSVCLSSGGERTA